MKKNKILTSISVFLILTAFAGMSIASSCGSDTTSKDETKAIVTDDSNETTDTDVETEETTETSETTENIVTTIEEQVILDQKGLKITAKEYVTDWVFSDSIKVEIENNTKKDLTVACRGLVVNGYVISDWFAEEVSSGAKCISEISLSSSQLRAAGIKKVGEVEIYFTAYGSNYKNIFKNPVHTTIKTSNYDEMDTSPEITGTEVYNKNGIRIVAQYVDEDSFWGAAILLYIENNSKKEVTIYLDKMSVNGYMVDGLMSTTIFPNRKSIDSVTIFGSSLTESDIESIDDVEMKLKIHDSKYKKIANPTIKFSTKSNEETTDTSEATETT